jgi:hypothetical protein
MNPSLIITPNVVDEGKLFSIVPTDGSGDLDVVRATSATRVDENGLVEIPRTNLRLQSTFEGGWLPNQLIITNNTVVSPDGTLNGSSVSIGIDVSSTRHRIIQLYPYTSGITYTASFFFKKNQHKWIQICAVMGFPFDTWANFDLENGVVGNNGGIIGLNPTIEDYGNGWYRCSITGIPPSTGSFTGFEVLLTDNTDSGRYPSYQSSVEENCIYVWGAQLEEGVTATEYIPTTDSIRTKFAGITQDGGSASNIARLDYSNGSCPSILVEPQRTNLVIQSNKLNTTPWSILLSEVSINENYDISPDGTSNANKINFLSGSTRFTQIFTVTSNTTYTLSFWVKNIDATSVSITIPNTSASTSIDYFSEISSDEWRRLSFTFTTNSGVTSIAPQITRDGSIGKSVLIYGVQLEQGSNATSYIPTTTASVTRNADVISKTGVSSLIGQTEGTLYWEGYLTRDISTGRILSVSTSDLSNRAVLNINNNRIEFINRSNLTNVNGTINTSALSEIVTGLNKIAVRYKSGDCALYVNGVLAGVSTLTFSYTSAIPNVYYVVNEVNSSNTNNASVKLAMLYKTALTDEQALVLTGENGVTFFNSYNEMANALNYTIQ